MRGASALNDLLAEFPNGALHVQVVWMPVLKTDLVPPLTRVLALLNDPRVNQSWDPEGVVSAELVRQVNADPARFGFEEPLPPDFIVWDAVAVFGREARWEDTLPVPAYHGGPVVHAMEDVRRVLAEHLAAAGHPYDLGPMAGTFE